MDLMFYHKIIIHQPYQPPFSSHLLASPMKRVFLSVCKVWDKLSLVSPSGENIGSLDRQAFAMTASYDLLRANGQKFGRVLVNSWIGFNGPLVGRMRDET